MVHHSAVTLQQNAGHIVYFHHLQKYTAFRSKDKRLFENSPFLHFLTEMETVLKNETG